MIFRSTNRQIIAFLVVLIILPSLLLAQQCKIKFGNDDGVCKPSRECLGAAVESNNNNCGTTNICCVDDVKVTIAEDKHMPKSTFLKLVGNTSRNDAMYSYFVQSMQLAGVNTGSNADYKMCTYLSQIVGESKVFERLESRYIDRDDDVEFGNSDIGDGEKWQGRGALYVRGKKDYELCNKANNIYSILIFEKKYKNKI